MSSFNQTIKDIGLRLKPDSIVGNRYSFATMWDNRPILIRGLVAQYLWAVGGDLYYVAKGDEEKPVTVFGLIRIRGEWRLQVRLEHAVMHLSGKFVIE